MKHSLLFTIGCALAITPAVAQAQDHQHVPSDSTASADSTQMQMDMAGMMGHMMTNMMQMHEMMCSEMMSSASPHMPADSVTGRAMGMMGEMMTTMGHMMRMMSQGGGMTHGNATDAEPLAPPASNAPRP